MKYFLPVKTLIVIQWMRRGFDAFMRGSIDKNSVPLQPQLIGLRGKEWHFKEHKQIKDFFFYAAAPDNPWSVCLCDTRAAFAQRSNLKKGYLLACVTG